MVKKKIIRREISDGKAEGLEVLSALDLNEVKDADEMLKAMAKTSFAGRNLGEAADVLYEMINDPECFVVGTFSGAMTPAQMGLVLSEMIDQGMLQAVVSTGALMTHGLVMTAGLTHFKYDFSYSDDYLCQKGYNRIYDTIELEKNLDDLEQVVKNIFNQFGEEEKLCSRLIVEKAAQYLAKNSKGRGIVLSALKKKIPVYIPAFTDSEFGLDLALHNRRRRLAGKNPLTFDPFLDLEHFAETIFKQKKLGIFTIGGGVPRNWAQQVCPYYDLIRKRIKNSGFEERDDVKYHYAVRICPEPVHWGGLSGCSYSEGVSWGKILDPKKGGRYAEVFCDATAVWPLLIKGVTERLNKNKKTINKKPEYAQ